MSTYNLIATQTNGQIYDIKLVAQNLSWFLPSNIYNSSPATPITWNQYNNIKNMASSCIADQMVTVMDGTQTKNVTACSELYRLIINVNPSAQPSLGGSNQNSQSGVGGSNQNSQSSVGGSNQPSQSGGGSNRPSQSSVGGNNRPSQSSVGDSNQNATPDQTDPKSPYYSDNTSDSTSSDDGGLTVFLIIFFILLLSIIIGFVTYNYYQTSHNNRNYNLPSQEDITDDSENVGYFNRGE